MTYQFNSIKDIEKATVNGPNPNYVNEQVQDFTIFSMSYLYQNRYLCNKLSYHLLTLIFSSLKLSQKLSKIALSLKPLMILSHNKNPSPAQVYGI